MDDYERMAKPIHKDEVCGKYDVLIIGGGVAGCAAALAAKRHGATVLLIEKMIMLGGLGTAGHVVIYLPLDDGFGKQVIAGISEEFLKLSVAYSTDCEIPNWQEEGKRYEVMYNGPAFALALEEKLLQEGIEILYDSLCVGADVCDKKIEALYIENKSGRSKIICGAVVDASGDAEIFARAGVPCVARKNSLAIWNYCLSNSEENIERRAEQHKKPVRVFG